MGFMAPKLLIFALFIIIVLVSLPSTALGGGRNLGKIAAPLRFTAKEHSSTNIGLHEEQAGSANIVARSRMLKVNTNDYGTYNPTPSLTRPPFKLIPN